MLERQHRILYEGLKGEGSSFLSPDVASALMGGGTLSIQQMILTLPILSSSTFCLGSRHELGSLS